MLADAVKKTKIPNYDTKVPESIKVANKEKIDSLNSQVTLLKEIIDILKKFWLLVVEKSISSKKIISMFVCNLHRIIHLLIAINTHFLSLSNHPFNL